MQNLRTQNFECDASEGKASKAIDSPFGPWCRLIRLYKRKRATSEPCTGRTHHNIKPSTSTLHVATGISQHAMYRQAVDWLRALYIAPIAKRGRHSSSQRAATRAQHETRRYQPRTRAQIQKSALFCSPQSKDVASTHQRARQRATCTQRGMEQHTGKKRTEPIHETCARIITSIGAVK